MKTSKTATFVSLGLFGSVVAVPLLLMPARVDANAFFARQTGLSCAECHSTPADPKKELLTPTGANFRSCIYNPNPGSTDCYAMARSNSLPVPQQPANSGYQYQQTANSGYSQSSSGNQYQQSANPGYSASSGSGFGQAANPAPTPAPAPSKKSGSSFGSFLGAFLGGLAASSNGNTGQNNNYGGSSGYQSGTQQMPAYNAPVSGYDPGRRWMTIEHLQNGRVLDSLWTRRGNTNQFDAVTMDSANGSQTNDLIFYEGFNNGRISFRRQSNGRVYSGGLTPDGMHVLGGTTNHSPPELTWSGAMER